MKVAEQDKRKMYHASRQVKGSDSSKNKSKNDVLVDVEEVGADSLPELQYNDENTDGDGWVTLHEPIMFL